MAEHLYQPSEMYLEVAPAFLFEDLAVQHELTTPEDRSNQIQTEPREVVSTLKEARALCRVLHAHFGIILEDFVDTIAGGVTTPGGLKTISEEGQIFRIGISKLINSIQNEKTGSNSFFQSYVRGVVCPDNCNVSVNSHPLCIC
jgi:hypothetical protein